ncbi:MAG: hypothetical protein A3G76_06890 [Acidobacteria bacterium RIFCSPLOWO2_12_FULL_65_11]|nr:MAG: hypothetical protein A3H95_12305 [Acidobacteria bacterium RIFCSPLOWO2_02_FULL_64_15]OFW34319.1 MAG: hypothetical protein A3G76_06890 [Acidobacteria bacterium RIFCSPLOWO2_12_FULL_65_11]
MTLHDCFADEIAIDFPSVGRFVQRIRAAFLDGHPGEDAEPATDVLTAEVRLSRRQAYDGLVVPLDLAVSGTCQQCGGRGETWAEPCDVCGGSGAALIHHPVRFSVPSGVADGARFRFRVSSRHAAPVRVEVRVAIRELMIEDC